MIRPSLWASYAAADPKRRRRIAVPVIAKPPISSAHVAGSGTPGTASASWSSRKPKAAGHWLPQLPVTVMLYDAGPAKLSCSRE